MVVVGHSEVQGKLSDLDESTAPGFEVLRPSGIIFPKVEFVNHLRVIMEMKKAARARARDAVAAAAAAARAPKKPSMGYITWKFIFQDKVIKTHQSPKKNAENIGNLLQIAESSNNPNEGLLAKPHVRRAPHTRKALGMRKLATKPSLVPRPVRRSVRNCDKKIAPQKRGKLGRVPSQEAILHLELSVIEVQSNGRKNAPGTVVTAGPVKNFSPSRLVSGSQNNDQEKAPGMNELGTSYMWQDPCLQVDSPLRRVENIGEQVKEAHEVCELEGTASLVEEPQQSEHEGHGRVPIDWATFDFNAAPFTQGNNPIISSYETQYEGMQMEIDTLSFSDATVDSYYILPNYEAADDILSLWD